MARSAPSSSPRARRAFALLNPIRNRVAHVPGIAWRTCLGGITSQQTVRRQPRRQAARSMQEPLWASARSCPAQPAPMHCTSLTRFSRRRLSNSRRADGRARFLADGVCQGNLDDLTREIRRLGSPRAEGRAEAVQDHLAIVLLGVYPLNVTAVGRDTMRPEVEA